MYVPYFPAYKPRLIIIGQHLDTPVLILSLSRTELPKLEVILDALAFWLESAQPAQRERFFADRTDAHRRFAFFLGQREGQAVLLRVVALFRLNDRLAGRAMKALLDELVEGGVYKEACQFLGALGLQEHYEVEEVRERVRCH